MTYQFSNFQKIIILPILFAGIFGIAFVADAAYTITAPAGGANWQAGTTHLLTWTGAVGGRTVKLQLIQVSPYVVYGDIISSTPDTGSYNWTIPAGVPPTAYQVYLQYNPASPIEWAYGSNFNITAAAETTPPTPPTTVNFGSASSNSLTASWSGATDNVAVTGYRLDVSTSAAFSSFVSGYNNLDVGNVLSRVVSGLNPSTTYYTRVRAYDAAGNISSNSASANGMTLAGPTIATFSATYKAPYCSGSNASCDTGTTLVNCRYGAETNQPNTIDLCLDGTYAGSCSTYESNKRLSVATVDGSSLAYGKAVTVSATVYCRNLTDRINLYYTASIPPAWTLFNTQSCTASGSTQVKTGSYTLPSTGTTHAVRAQITYGAAGSVCDSSDVVSDRDDLVFDVQLPDGTAPAAVSNLAASSPTVTSISLSWTAPGDDGSSGTATSYDVRYSTALITDANWASAMQASGEPAPAVAGTSQSMTVSSLNAGTTYYFAMKTSDEISNVSALSNVPSMATLPPPPPTVATNAASAITPTSATLNGSANPNGYATTGWFRYSATNPGSCTDSFGTRLPASGGAALGSGSVSAPYSNPTGSVLTSGTTYYYCAIASNSGGTALGTVVSFFVPLPAAPTFPTPLAANPTSVVSGGPSTLTWASSGATSCSASANPVNSNWTGAKALSGSQSTGVLTVTTAFTLTCTNAGGSTPSSATVTVTPPPNVSGHAWAGSGVGANGAAINANPGIGWIKMSGTATDGSPYGVLVSSASPGVLSGYAWANPNDGGTNNIGWIDFGPAGSYPASSFVSAQSARMDRTTGLVTGWARACSVFASGCSGALKADSERGGWDGWIGFGSGGNYTQPVTVSGCNWSGYAWGGGINIGWIHFGGALYPMTGSGDACASVTPQCSDGIDNDGDGLIDLTDPGCIDGNDDNESGPTAPSGVSADAGSGLACNAIIVSWTDNATDESRFELERKLTSQADNFYVEIAEPAVDSTSFPDTGSVGGLLRDTSYTYRIRACNAFGCGAYSNADAAINQNPLAQFTWTPPTPLKNANATFNGVTSAVYGGASKTEYFWTFVDGIPATFCSSVAGSGCNNPPLTSLASARFQLPPAPAQKSVTLRITDSASRQCSVTQAVPVRSGSVSPKWLEVAPE